MSGPNLTHIAMKFSQLLDPDDTGDEREEVPAAEVVESMRMLGVPLDKIKRMISASDALNDNGSIRAFDFMAFLLRSAKEEKEKASLPTLRFQVGTKVLCRTGEDEWSAGSIVQLHYREPNWPPSRKVPYQVELDDGTLIFVPMDSPALCKKLEPPWWEELMAKMMTMGSSRIALREAAAGKDINQRDHKGSHVLHVAASANWLEGVDELISLKADVNMYDKTHATALHKAVSLPDAQEMVQKLCAAGAELNSQDLNPDFDPEFTSVTFGDRKMHRTPLHYSSEIGDVDTMRILIDFKADVNMQDGAMKTPLHLAIQEDELTAIDLLLQSGADVHASCLQSGMKNSLLMDAAHCSKHSIAEKLIEARANVNQQGKSDMAAIHLAARRGDAKMVQILLSARADITQKSACGTALNLAKQKGGEELLLILGDASSQHSLGSASSVAKMSAGQRAALYMD